MKRRRFFTHAEIGAAIAKRPEGYREDFEACVTRRDDRGVHVDIDSPAWLALLKKYAPNRVNNPAAKHRPGQEHWGPKKWRALHYYARLWTGPEAAKAWVQRWIYSLPNIGCGCQDHARLRFLIRPLDYSSPEAFFRSTVDFHNDVNALTNLNKPAMSHADAGILYGFTLG